MKKFWFLWLLLTLGIGGYYGYVILEKEEKSELLIGQATHGHYQIELACDACHQEAFGGDEVLQNACVDCHQEELKKARDSHPMKKFTDPRNADRLEVLDARFCVTCHKEHQHEQTGMMGLTLPEDYCWHCHQDVGDDRPSHEGLAFDSCATAGCHNYHDNTALYEDFLVDNAGGAWVKAMERITQVSAASQHDFSRHPHNHLTFDEKSNAHSDIHLDWLESTHGEAGVSCGGCHTESDGQWLEKPAVEQCQTCHEAEAKGFLEGMHGMRTAQNMSALQPSMAQNKFRSDALEKAHGCNSCHSAHDFDTVAAAVDGCLQCHSDEHSLNYIDSPHGQAWVSASAEQRASGELVSCATCHMPREHKKVNGVDVYTVQHNQNFNLRPNEKMIRPVCMDCHSLAFAIDALADTELIKSNFAGQPSEHIPSIDWAVKRVEE